jgi:hypothetical protein
MLAAYRELFHPLREQRRGPVWELPLPDLPDGPYVPKEQSTAQTASSTLSGSGAMSKDGRAGVGVSPARADGATSRRKGTASVP